MRSLLISFFAVLTICTTTAAQDRLAKYRKYDAYEVRPGIVVIPTYGKAGQICQMGIEKLHYSPEIIRLDSDISRADINDILDELIPAPDRGAPVKGFAGNSTNIVGNSFSTTSDFENIWIKIYAKNLPSDKKDRFVVNQVLAIVKWKTRSCQ